MIGTYKHESHVAIRRSQLDENKQRRIIVVDYQFGGKWRKNFKFLVFQSRVWVCKCYPSLVIFLDQYKKIFIAYVRNF